jgi:hypothetical protein
MVIASAHAEFGPSGDAEVDTSANCGLAADGTCDLSSFGHAQLLASYQMTFSGSSGPGYIQPELCADIHGYSSGSFVTPNGSISSGPGCRTAKIPIVFGVPLDVQLALQADSFDVGLHATGAVGAFLDFLPVLDAQLNPVAATVDVAIPEPSTGELLMIAAGLFLMGARARRIGGSPRPRHSTR